METKNTDKISFPETLIEAVRQFSDLNYATKFFAQIRWPDGVTCPHCGSTQVDYVAKRRVWECRQKHARAQFSVKIGTIFEECRLSIDKCLIAIWLEVNAKNSISSYEIARHLGVTQKTGWFLLHRVRHALKVGSFDTKLAGTVEADETYIGGLRANMHKEKRAALSGRGGAGKTIVMGLLQRHTEKGKSKVRTEVLEGNVNRGSLHPVIYKMVEPGTQFYTDAHSGYTGLGADYIHGFIDHAEKYVEGQIHTNGLENFWALFKRCIKGTHVSIEPFHLEAYLNSECFRFNHRKTDDGNRFMGALPGTEGKRLTYKALTGRDDNSEGAQGNDSGGASGDLLN
ncbi:MAG: IS1595 family transposase [Planctomycetota bacterium]|nr:IS1595 family transposase [Planctomycetota bacterium]